jgi:UDP-N-acetyl-D-galactosamine dehydrogenase
VNELAIIFHEIGIDTQEVLEAAGTKWNFLPFRPGLVGGHCIGVDPYYLTYKAVMAGYHPQVILSGRKINDGMGKYIAEQTVKRMILKGFKVNEEPVIVLGITFKEDCPDIRNSRVVDVIRELQSFGARVFVHDPMADADETLHEYGLRLTTWDDLPKSAAMVAAVSHKAFSQRSNSDIADKLAPGGVYVDVKSKADAGALAARGIEVWRL